MTDNKLSDNEIIKDLDGCSNCYEFYYCPHCAYNVGVEDCSSNLMKDALSLINRQKARIDLLEKDNKYLAMRLKNAETNAFVEFGDRLKLAFFEDYEIKNSAWIKVAEHIDTLVKEMVGDDNG